MTVEYFVYDEPEYWHEREAVLNLAQTMKSAFTPIEDFYLLAINVPLARGQIDAMVLKRDAVIAVELKSGQDAVCGRFDNQPWHWKTSNSVVHSGSQKHRNPYEQIVAIREALKDYLSRTSSQFLIGRRIKDAKGGWSQVSAAIMFSPYLYEDSDLPKLGKLHAWLEIGGLNEIADYLYARRSPKIDLRPEEMRRLARTMGCKEYTQIESLLPMVATYGHLWLLDETGERTYPFPIVDSAKIGRSRKCELIVPPRFDHTSRRHAYLRVKGDVVFLHNDNSISEHVTFVGGQPVPEDGLMLEDGAIISLGIVDHPSVCRLLFERKLRLDNVVGPTPSTAL